MLKKYNKIISAVLTVSIMFSNCSLVSFANCDEDCTKTNKNGQFVSECCAEDAAMERLSNGEHYVKMENVGRNSDYTVYVFDYNNIEKVISELPYTSLKEIRDTFEREENLETQRKDSIIEWIKFGSKLTSSMGVALLAITHKNSISHFIDKALKITQNVNSFNKRFNTNINSENVNNFLGNAIASSTTVIPAMILSSTPESIPKMQSINYREIFYDNSNTLCALQQILDGIKYRLWKNNDVLLIVTNSEKGSLSSVASFKSYGINYTEQEKQTFENKFNDLNETLQKKLNEYGKEQEKAYGEI